MNSLEGCLTISRVQVALARPQGTPHRLQLDGLHASLPQPEREVVQARESRGDVATRPGPEDFGGRSGARPDDRVEVLRARLLRPEGLLACRGQRGRDARE